MSLFILLFVTPRYFYFIFVNLSHNGEILNLYHKVRGGCKKPLNAASTGPVVDESLRENQRLVENVLQLR